MPASATAAPMITAASATTTASGPGYCMIIVW
jgi:hypothetical protein